MNNNTTSRIVAAIVSVLITMALLNSVIIGMTATAAGSASMTVDQRRFAPWVPEGREIGNTSRL